MDDFISQLIHIVDKHSCDATCVDYTGERIHECHKVIAAKMRDFVKTKHSQRFLQRLRRRLYYKRSKFP